MKWQTHITAATYGTPWGSGLLVPNDCPPTSLVCHMVRYYLGADSQLLREKIAGSAAKPAERIEYMPGRNPLDFRTAPRVMVYLTSVPEETRPSSTDAMMIGVEVGVRWELSGVDPIPYGGCGVDGAIAEVLRVLRLRRTLPVSFQATQDRELAYNSNFVGLDYYGPDVDAKTGRVLVTNAVRWLFECYVNDADGKLQALVV